jgi:peptide/nickel transport system permease protein
MESSAALGLGAVPAFSPRSRLGGITVRGWVGIALVGIVLVAGLIGPLLVAYGANQQIAGATLLAPDGAHPLGTDELGRDVLSRLLTGIRVDLLMVFVAVPIGAAIGSLVGLLAAGSRFADMVTQRAFDLILSFPVLILAIALTAVFGPGVMTIAVVIGIAEIPIFGRLMRTSVLTVRELPYVEASRVVGASRWWVLRKHVLPNSLEPLTVQLAISMSIAVFVEGAMSYLGIGVRPPSPSLGSLIQSGMKNVHGATYLPVGPLVVVCMLSLGFLLIAQSIAGARRA